MKNYTACVIINSYSDVIFEFLKGRGNFSFTHGRSCKKAESQMNTQTNLHQWSYGQWAAWPPGSEGVEVWRLRGRSQRRGSRKMTRSTQYLPGRDEEKSANQPINQINWNHSSRTYQGDKATLRSPRCWCCLSPRAPRQSSRLACEVERRSPCSLPHPAGWEGNYRERERQKNKVEEM